MQMQKILQTHVSTKPCAQDTAPEIINSISVKYNKTTSRFSDTRGPLHGKKRICYANGEELIGKFQHGKCKEAVITKDTRKLNIMVDAAGVAKVKEESMFSELSYQFKFENINGTNTYTIIPRRSSEDCITETTIYSTKFGYFPPDGAIAVVEQFFPVSNTLLRRSGKYSGCLNKPFGNSLNSFQVYVGKEIVLATAAGYPITINADGEIVGHCRLDTINPNNPIIEMTLFKPGGLFARVVVCVSEQFADSKYHYLLDITPIQTNEFRKSYISYIENLVAYRERADLVPANAAQLSNIHRLFYLIFHYMPSDIKKIALSTGHPELLYKIMDNTRIVIDDILKCCGHISGLITLAKLQHFVIDAVRLYKKLLGIPVLSNEEHFYALKKLGDCYANGDTTLPRNFKMAVNYYKQALNLAKFLPPIASVHILVSINGCYIRGDEHLLANLTQAKIYYNQFTEVWRYLPVKDKFNKIYRYCRDSKISYAIYLCCHELQLQAAFISKELVLPELVKMVMNTIYIHVDIGIFSKIRIKYKDLPDIIRNHNYQCPLSLTQFNQEPEYDLQELEVIICAKPSGHITIYEYDAFCNSIKTARKEHPGMLESIMFFVEPRLVKENEVGTPIYPIDFNNPTSEKIFWWYFK